MEIKTLCCNAEITDHLTFINYHGEGRTNFICCSVCGKAAGNGLFQKSQQDYQEEMETGTVLDQTLKLRASVKNLLFTIAEELQLERIIKILNQGIKTSSSSERRRRAR